MADLAAEIVDHFERNKDDYYAKRGGDELRLHRTALGALVRAVEDAGGVPLREALACFMAGDDAGRTVDGGRAEALVRVAVGRGCSGRPMWGACCAALRHRRRR